MKSVLISIQPRWCELIASGRKTVEVRKTRPKLETPFKVYIYCTQGDSLNYLKRFAHPKLNKYWIDNKAYGCNVARANGKVIGEFICNKIEEFHKFILEQINRYEKQTVEDILKKSCLTFNELSEYLTERENKEPFYIWNILNLVIYEKPRELSEFKQVKKIRGYHKKDEPKTEGINIHKLLNSSRVEVKYFSRPPQSWCYVESEG